MKLIRLKDGTSIPKESLEHVEIIQPDEWDEYYSQNLKVDKEDAGKIIAFLKKEFGL